MSGDRPTNPEPPSGAPATLGGLLYAQKAHDFVPESDWVQLVRAIGAGDQDALHALYQRTHRIVFTLIVRITHDSATAEELTVDVFYGVWRRAAQYDATTGTVLGWMLNQARSRAIDRLRFDHRKKRVNPYPDSPAEPLCADPSDQLDSDDRNLALRAALTKLTPAERRAIESAFFGEMSYAEVAERLNEPLGTIKTRVRSGLDKLRNTLLEAEPER